MTDEYEFYSQMFGTYETLPHKNEHKEKLSSSSIILPMPQ